MSAGREEAVQKQVTIYLRVFSALAILTVLTVGVSYLKLPLAIGICAALAIAALKASLVAGFFMHLVSERKIVYLVLAVAAFFFIFLLLLPSLHRY